MSQAQPLNDQELAELDDFLLSDHCDDDTLGIDELHGFLSALLVLPETPAEAEWLPVVWGEPRFTDAAHQARMHSSLQRMVAEIRDSLHARQDFEPLVVEVEEEGEPVEVWEGWCQGFVLAMEMYPEHWEQLPKHEQALVLPMAQLALLEVDDELEMEEQEYQDWVELIPGAVMGLYAYWHSA